MQETRLKFHGIYSLQNPYSEVPDGALEIADNIVIDRDGIASPRRGFQALSDPTATLSGNANVLYEYGGYLLAHYGASTLGYYDSTNSKWVSFSGTFNPPDSTTRVYSTQASGNFYFTTASGVYKLDSVAGATPTLSGIPKALNADVSLVSGSFFSAGNQVAYRYVWGKRDANNNLLLGTPSQRTVIINSGASAQAVQHTVYIPQGITTSHFLQIYRTALSGSATVDPGDEMYLVYEASPLSSDISSGSMAPITDDTPTDLTGATLYTSPSQEGILQGNDQPPLAKDITTFLNYTFYANTTSKQRFYLTLLGVKNGTSSVNGLQSGDTVTVAGVTFTAGTSFTLSTASSASQRIDDTALSLVKAINASAASVYAFYLSGPDDLPGQMLLEERGIGGNTFTVTTSRSTAFSPDLTTQYSSTDDSFQNGIMISKFQQPEAVPITNVIRVGSSADPILRIVPLRSSILIFKQKEGVFKLTGDSINNFRVDLFTSSTRLLAKDSAQVLDNQVYCLTDQGVAALTEINAQVISRPIEDKLLDAFGASLDSVKNLTWAVAYESDRKYILSLITESTDTTCTQCFVWNIFTSTWTRWVMTRRCGFVRPSDNKLYLGDAVNSRVSVERKTYSFRDIVDEAVAVNVTAVNGATLTLSSVDNVAVGDVLWESDSVYGVVRSVDTVNITVTLGFDAGFSTGAASILKAFPCTVKWVPFVAFQPPFLMHEPMLHKHWREASLIFDQDFSAGTISFTSELSQSLESVAVTGTAPGLFGLFPFGMAPFGGQTARRVARTYVPLEKQRCSQLSVQFDQSQGYSDFRLAGIQAVFDPMSEKGTT